LGMKACEVSLKFEQQFMSQPLNSSTSEQPVVETLSQ
jgi:hypothetical protein